MIQRIELLKSLLQFNQPLSQVLPLLKTFIWDSDSELVILTRQDVAHVLRRYIRGELSQLDVEDWANAIEGREDVGYEGGFEAILDEVIYELANPLLNRPLSHNSAKDWLQQLTGSTPASVIL